MYICEACHKQFMPKETRPSRAHRFCSISCFNTTKRREPETHFWSYVEKTDGCWLWNGYKDAKGYGYFGVRGKTRKAHRVAYELTYGVSLGSLLGCHSCDNPSCVRPDHIFPGTHRDNAHDAFSKGRRKVHFANSRHAGTENGRAKLSNDDVANIRRLADNGVSEKEIGRLYPIKQTQINKIIRRVAWKHVPESGEE